MSDPTDFAAVRACVFDAYGTLLDVGTPVAAEAAALGPSAPELASLWRRKQLEYSWLRSLMRRHADFEALAAHSLDHAMEALGIADPPLRERLLLAYRRLAAFPDVAPALRRLRELKVPTAILSNGTGAMLAEGLAAAGIAHLLDLVLSVEEVGVFKPAPEVYALATARLGLAAGSVAFISSNGWDIHGASSFGLRAIWLNRAGLPAERLPGRPERVIEDLSRLPDLIAPTGERRA